MSQWIFKRRANFQEKSEVIFVGNGVGFNKKVNQPFEGSGTFKEYHLGRKTEKGPTDSLLNSVDPLYVEIASAVIDLSEEAFGHASIDNNILLPLADHIAFSVVRMKANMSMSNPFSEDIRLLYKDEYNVALKAKDIIEARTGFFIPDGELAYISLYIHSALNDTQVSNALQIPVIIRRSIDRIQKECHIENIDGFAYNRLLYHIKCMLARSNKNEKLNQDIIAFTREKYGYAYSQAEIICQELGKELGETFSEAEISFLALHIERIKTIPD